MTEKRKLAAVMFTDIVGYTALMSKDEQKAMALLKKNRELQKSLTKKHNGEFLKEMGDGTILCFQSALDAVHCAMAIQESTKNDPDLNLRIGIHLGDIVFKDSDVFGAGVNIASRIEGLADPGGICISEEIDKSIRNYPEINTEFIGEKQLKNIGHPVKVYRLGISSRERNSLPEPAETDKKSIIVLPFDDMSQNKDNEYFSDGLTEEIITDLAYIHDLLVISRSSAMTFKGTNKKIKEIAREVNVQFVLEGSVRKAGNNLRITAQLIDAASDTHLWAEKYSGTLDDVFDIQEKVSRSIVDALKMKLTFEEEKQIAKRSIDNVHAYDCWIQANYDLSKCTKEAIENAINNLQNALDIIGDNALLYAGMGYAYFTYVNSGFGGENLIDKAVQYVQKAFVLDPDIPQGHFLMGAINISFYGDQQLSIEHYDRALLVDPNNSTTMYWLGTTFLTVGKMLEVDQLAKKISQVDPVNIYDTLLITTSNLFNGHYERALKLWEKAIQLTPEHPYIELMRATNLSYLKRYDEAITLINKSAKTSPDNGFTKLGILLKFALQGKNSEMFHSISQDLEIWAKRDPWWSWMMAERYSLLGMKEKALDWLENSVDKGYINYPHLNEHSPLLENIRNEERFKELMKRVKHEWENFEV